MTESYVVRPGKGDLHALGEFSFTDRSGIETVLYRESPSIQEFSGNGQRAFFILDEPNWQAPGDLSDPEWRPRTTGRKIVHLHPNNYQHLAEVAAASGIALMRYQERGPQTK